jgi:hypothetical protein
VSFKKGKLTTPFGTEFVGFIITVGGVTDPAEIHRTYEDIDKIFKSNPETFKTHEERDEKGRFKSYSVSTG